MMYRARLKTNDPLNIHNEILNEIFFENPPSIEEAFLWAIASIKTKYFPFTKAPKLIDAIKSENLVAVIYFEVERQYTEQKLVIEYIVIVDQIKPKELNTPEIYLTQSNPFIREVAEMIIGGKLPKNLGGKLL